MSIRTIVSSIAISAALLTAQAASAQSLQFFQKAQEVNAAQAKVDGKLAVRLTINTDGSVKDVRVTRTSGNSSIDNQAIAWMGSQTLRPAFVNGEAQEFSVVKEIKFSKGGEIQLGLKK
ncbi:energy transducer TonB [Neisseria canis]|uniref:TonB family C-terminal domain n=1 Tax=Neisseria canis TaxID=493 RepID=A0A448D846_9NEIS|nr:TonB family protein [Neisseria canis]OSI10137.1 energy transducer TonB [Neisseria canis]VEF01136.1 TonB family C-terminal domain [Neisseria canis]